MWILINKGGICAVYSLQKETNSGMVFFVWCRISGFSLFTLCEYRNHPSEILIPKNSSISNTNNWIINYFCAFFRYVADPNYFYCGSNFFALCKSWSRARSEPGIPKNSEGKRFNYSPPELREDGEHPGMVNGAISASFVWIRKFFFGSVSGSYFTVDFGSGSCFGSYINFF